MGLINSDDHYLEVEQVNTHNVQVSIYESKAIFDAGLKPYFETRINTHFHCSEELFDKLKETAASGSSSKKIWDNMVAVAEALIVEQAAEKPERHIHADIKGDWVLWVAA